MKAVALVLLVSACAAFTPAEPFARFWPPLRYRLWWAETWASCGAKVASQPQRGLDEIAFFVVGAERFETPLGVAVGAYSKGRIYVAHPYLGDPHIVRHEMLHAMLDDYSHPPIFAECKL